MTRFLLLPLALLGIAGSLSAAEPKIQFNRDVRPLLADACFACHGPDRAKRKADLRLDTAEGGRKSYRLTEDGRPEAETAAQNPPWSQIGADTMSQVQDFRDAAVGIMGALKQVGFNGSAEQRQKALEVLNETKRKLYAILAESE